MSLLNLMFPPVCVFCLKPLNRVNTEPNVGRKVRFPASGSECFDAGVPFCWSCQEDLAGGTWDACVRCAAPRKAGRCPYCAERAYAFDESYALNLYQETCKEAVLRTKQGRFECLTLGVGRLLGRRLSEVANRQRILEGRHWQASPHTGLNVPPLGWAIPIPSHWSRRLKRGVHSAALLADGVAAELQIPLAVKALTAVRRTKKQGTLEPQQRFQNVRAVFRASKRYDFTDAHVLLVDDVMTTGATLHEAARTLKRAGAAKVSVAVVARGTGD